MQKNTGPSILFINRVYPPGRGATGRLLQDLAQRFAAQGWDVTVLATGPRATVDHDGPVRVVRVKTPGKSKTVWTYGLIWLKLFFKGWGLPAPDMVVTMSDPPLLVMAGDLLSRIKGARHMHWAQDVYPDLFPVLGVRFSPFIYERMKNGTRRALKRCDKVVTIGRCMARHFTHAGIEPGRVAVIPNWPDRELCAPEGGSVNSAAQVSSKKDVKSARPFAEQIRDGQMQKFRVLYAGNLGRGHPLKAVLQAADFLKKDYPEIEFLFVGSGCNYERLARERARAELRNIKLLPFQPAARLKEVMESGDVHLVTMREESCGLLMPSKLYSAIAAERPCLFVGPEKSEAARVITEFSCGAVLPVGDGRALAEAILNYRTNSAAWFAAYEGARKARAVFVPGLSMDAFISRALEIVQGQGKRR